jgi:hypothetical protein
MRAWIWLSVFGFVLALPHALYAQSKESLKAVVAGDSVTIVNLNVVENCAARFAVEVRVNGPEISVIERDTIPEKARCICEYTISATVRGLLPGSYEAEIVREYLKKFNYGADTTVSIGRIAFTVGEGSSRPVSFAKEQSDCLSTSVPPLPETPFFITVAPNPMRGSALLTVELVSASPVTVELFSPLGQRVRRFEFDVQPPGLRRFPLAADLLPASGRYLCLVTVAGRSACTPVFVLR